MFTTYLYHLLGLLAVLNLGLSVHPVQAQTGGDAKAMEILDKALKVGDELNLALHFQSIGFGLADPRAIYTLPAAELYPGGHVFLRGQQYEMQLGMLKVLCDGKLVVVVNEQEQAMFIDSVRTKTPGKWEQEPELGGLIKDRLLDGELSYRGTETLNGISCYKIKATYPENPGAEVLYWIREKDNKLLLMAEKQQDTYDVYRVQKVGKTPASHQFKVSIPKQELTKLYGYQVHDLRYAWQQE